MINIGEKKSGEMRNRKRDRLVTKQLQNEGWRVLRIWEHSLKLQKLVMNRINYLPKWTLLKKIGNTNVFGTLCPSDKHYQRYGLLMVSLKRRRLNRL